jgi:hypothetical protein
VYFQANVVIHSSRQPINRFDLRDCSCAIYMSEILRKPAAA